MTPFSFQILTPERIVYEGSIISLVAPGQEGYLGVLAHHAPMLAALTAGEVKITEGEGKPCYFAVSGGMLEVERPGVILLADAAEKAEEIDIQRAEAARSRALSRLSHRRAETDITRAQAALIRAMNRLRVAARRGPRE